MFKKIAIGLLLIIASTQSFSQLKVSNKGSHKIDVSIGYYSSALLKMCWVTEGWYRIEVGETATILTKPLNQKYYYVYGKVEGCDAEYSGSTALVVDIVSAFSIDNPDQAATLQSSANYHSRKFLQIDVEDKTDYTITLGQSNCMLNGKREGEWAIYFDRDWEQTSIMEDASYFRKIRYQDGLPMGIVRDYYM